MKAGHIVGVCSAKNEAIVRQHGATEVVDYNKVICIFCQLLSNNTYFYSQHDISTYFESEGDKFDLVYDACTNSGAGEDYKDKVIFACL